MIDRGADQLEALDRKGYLVVEALHAGSGHSPHTASRPETFVCIDGRTYWVKGTAQQGLVSELIVGRLAELVGAGPLARIVHVSDIAGATAQNVQIMGLLAGSLDVPDTVNARDLQTLTPAVQLPSSGINPVSRARVIAFQTWIGVSDAQVLIRLTDGEVLTIDHGDAFGSTSAADDPAIAVTPIPGLSDTIGKRAGHIMPAVDSIQRVTDRQLLECVAGIPSGSPWRSPAPRRLEIAEYLAHRRDRLQEVIRTWLST